MLPLLNCGSQGGTQSKFGSGCGASFPLAPGSPSSLSPASGLFRSDDVIPMLPPMASWCVLPHTVPPRSMGPVIDKAMGPAIDKAMRASSTKVSSNVTTITSSSTFSTASSSVPGVPGHTERGTRSSFGVGMGCGGAGMPGTPSGKGLLEQEEGSTPHQEEGSTPRSAWEGPGEHAWIAGPMDSRTHGTSIHQPFVSPLPPHDGGGHSPPGSLVVCLISPWCLFGCPPCQEPASLALDTALLCMHEFVCNLVTLSHGS